MNRSKAQFAHFMSIKSLVVRDYKDANCVLIVSIFTEVNPGLSLGWTGYYVSRRNGSLAYVAASETAPP